MNFSITIIQNCWQKLEIETFPGADSSADDDGRLLEGSQLSLQNVQGIRGFTGGGADGRENKVSFNNQTPETNLDGVVDRWEGCWLGN